MRDAVFASAFPDATPEPMIETLLARYGTLLPYHPGKWRLVEAVVRAAGLLRGDDHRIATRGGIQWDLHIRDIVQRSVYFLGAYEIHETRWLLSNIQPGWTACDIGANFGYYSHLIARHGGPNAVIHAFEPNPRSYAALCRIRDLNRFDNLHPHAEAVAAQAGEIDLETPPAGNEGIGRILAPGATLAPHRTVTRVKAVTLDDVADREGLTRLDFVKIDVEGAEPGVLEGGRATLRRLRPRMLVEINPESLESMGSSAAALLDAIRALGFTAHRLRGTRLEPVTAPPAFPDYINAICLPA